MENEKWIEDAFNEAAGKEEQSDKLVRKIVELFAEDFPRTMTAYEMTYGRDKGNKMALMMLTHTEIFTLCKCFFISGYRTRAKEEKGGSDNA